MPSPIVALNRAVAVGMAQGPAAGLHTLDAITAPSADSVLAGYHLLHSVRGGLCSGKPCGGRRRWPPPISSWRSRPGNYGCAIQAKGTPRAVRPHRRSWPQPVPLRLIVGPRRKHWPRRRLGRHWRWRRALPPPIICWRGCSPPRGIAARPRRNMPGYGGCGPRRRWRPPRRCADKTPVSCSILALLCVCS